MKIHLYTRYSSHGGTRWMLNISEATRPETNDFSDIAYEEAETMGLRLRNHYMQPFPDDELEHDMGADEALILEHAERVAERLSAELTLDPPK